MATTRRSAPRDQLLATASRLFYNDGINSVGVDRVLQEAGVTRATLYRHDAYRHHTRGCPFIKAAGEFPDPGSPVHQVISKHRAWFHAELRRLLTEAGRDDVDAKAETLAMLRDALMVGCFLDDPDVTRRAFVRNARWVAGLR
ncbi:TetR family transcriptional regulator [Micromonospora sp. CPCC 206171]|uniref:TetR/AcrR family transcriptional regulator n=1 Tax=Micromonospora sp. CPCC 206171 TaxID=3122405 RepID=UPI002FF1D611